jgi:hypothetical protein
MDDEKTNENDNEICNAILLLKRNGFHVGWSFEKIEKRMVLFAVIAWAFFTGVLFGVLIILTR